MYFDNVIDDRWCTWFSRQIKRILRIYAKVIIFRYDILYTTHIDKNKIGNLKINVMRITPLLLAGLAAFGYYKFNQMTDEQKNDLKEKGKKFMGIQYLQCI